MLSLQNSKAQRYSLCSSKKMAPGLDTPWVKYYLASLRTRAQLQHTCKAAGMAAACNLRPTRGRDCRSLAMLARMGERPCLNMIKRAVEEDLQHPLLPFRCRCTQVQQYTRKYTSTHHTQATMCMYVCARTHTHHTYIPKKRLHLRALHFPYVNTNVFLL